MKRLFVIVSVALFFVSFVIVCIFGNKCTLKYDISNMENISLHYDSRLINCIEKKQTDKTLEIELSSVSAGKTDFSVTGDKRADDGTYEEKTYEELVYVHENGVITIDTYFGRCRGDIAFFISSILIMIMLLIMLIRNYRWNLKKGMYRYENILLLGLIVFVIFLILLLLYFWGMMLYYGYSTSVFDIISLIQNGGFEFSFIILPVAAIVSLFASVTNIILLFKEGKTFRNMLGIFIGCAICLSTLALIIIEILLPYDFLWGFGYLLVNIFMTYITYLECILIGTVISCIISARHIPKFDKDYIIILGCMIRKDGTLTPLLKARVDRAVEFSKMQKEATGKDIVFVPSGGQGEDEVMPEGEAMRNYLRSIGIAEDKILVENKSVNTFENIEFSNKLIQDRDGHHNIAFSTTNYHVYRAGVICDKLNVKAEGIGAKTSTYFSINAFLREFIATLVSQKKHHIRILIILMLVLLLNEAFIYISVLL